MKSDLEKILMRKKKWVVFSQFRLACVSNRIRANISEECLTATKIKIALC